MSQENLIKKSEEYSTFDECYQKVELYCKEKYVNFFVQDSHRLTGKEQHIWKDKLLKCVYSGDPDKIKSKSAGIRTTQHYHATNCPWFIKIIYQSKYNNYIIKDCILHHDTMNQDQILTASHLTTIEAYNHHSNQNQLTEEIKKKVKDALSANAKPAKVLAQINKELGTNIQARQIYNLNVEKSVQDITNDMEKIDEFIKKRTEIDGENAFKKTTDADTNK